MKVRLDKLGRLTRSGLLGAFLWGPLLLGGCGGSEGETRSQNPLSESPTPQSGAAPFYETAAGCVDVKSRALDLGIPFKGITLCIEGTAVSSRLSKTDNSVEISLDTKTGNTNSSLYTVEIYIGDYAPFGLDNITNITPGTRLRARGTFLKSRIGDYFLKIDSPDQLDILF